MNKAQREQTRRVDAHVSELEKTAILEALKPEKVHVALRHLARQQVVKDFADHACKLESVAGEAGCHRHLGKFRMLVNQETAVGSHRIEAGLRTQ
jgi:hypothetical protein